MIAKHQWDTCSKCGERVITAFAPLQAEVQLEPLPSIIGTVELRPDGKCILYTVRGAKRRWDEDRKVQFYSLHWRYCPSGGHNKSRKEARLHADRE